MPRLHQAIDADYHNSAEENHQNAAHGRGRYGLEEGSQFAHKGQQNRDDGRPGHDAGIETAGEGHGSSHFGVGGVGRATKERR